LKYYLDQLIEAKSDLSEIKSKIEMGFRYVRFDSDLNSELSQTISYRWVK